VRGFANGTRQPLCHVRDQGINGRGIDSAVLAPQGREGHFGLPGMPERAALIGGDLSVWSEVDAGTEVELCVPAGAAYVTPRERRWFTGKVAFRHEAGDES
jgi:nitrate/nitrite-specific signal transduction histidine kinase